MPQSPTVDSFTNSFSPGRIGRLELRNRLVMAATSTELADGEGHVTESMIEFYAERARGGAGLLVVEATYVEQAGRRLRFNAMLDDDRFVAGMRRLVDAVHTGGSKAALQLAHGGRESRPEITGLPPIAPSPIASQHTSVGEATVPREMSLEDIDRVTRRFVEAAERAKAAGFDAIELHGAHGYLIGQFTSPESNRREDEFGGSTSKRARFYVEVIAAIKRALGPDFPVIARMNAHDFVPQGLEPKEAAEIAAHLEDAGADAISVSAGIHASRPYAIIPNMAIARGCYADLAAAVKARVRVPIMTVGRINTPAVGEAILAAGAADFVCLSRALLADPHFPEKARTGRVNEIVPCIACNECVASVHRHRGVSCTMNPMASREIEYRNRSSIATSPGRVVVIGGGVAGMSAAAVAARRGHETHLIERSAVLGGQLGLAHRPPHREELKTALTHFTGELTRAGVTLHLGRSWSIEEVVGFAPDHVILATGAESRRPNIPGVDLPHVMFGWQVIEETRQPGKNCVVIGGGLVGVEVADFLVERGHHVVLVARGALLSKAVWADRVYYLDRLRDLDIETMTRTAVLGIEPRHVDVLPEGHLPRRLMEIDAVIVCTGYDPRDQLASLLSEAGVDVKLAGDVLGSRKFLQAIEEGTSAASAL